MVGAYNNNFIIMIMIIVIIIIKFPDSISRDERVKRNRLQEKDATKDTTCYFEYLTVFLFL